MTRAVIFDVDGTLVDSVDLHAKSWVDAFAAFNHDVSFDAVRGQIGKGGDQLLPVFLSADAIEREGARIEARRGDVLKERYLPQLTAFPGVRDLFERILADQQRIALASSAKADELQFYKQLANIGDLLDTETTSDDAERSKPHPDIFAAALRRLDGIDPGDIVVVGDTPYDAEAAGKAGLRTVGLLCGGWPEAELRRAGCVAVYRDPADLLARYETSPLARKS